MQVHVLLRIPHTDNNKPGKVFISVSLFLKLMDRLLVSRREFSAIKALLTSSRGFTEALALI